MTELQFIASLQGLSQAMKEKSDEDKQLSSSTSDIHFETAVAYLNCSNLINSLLDTYLTKPKGTQVVLKHTNVPPFADVPDGIGLIEQLPENQPKPYVGTESVKKRIRAEIDKYRNETPEKE